MDNEALMREAMALAVQGRGDVEPNPRVGAVALQNGEIVGRGFHTHWGGPHAEVVALDDALKNRRQADTLVVTLEPCSSDLGAANKKTPPCTERIKLARLKTVVVGAEDADPRHLQRGVRELRRAGVQVVEGVLARECAELNPHYTRWLEMERPWTIAKWAMSLDGKTAARSGDARWISGEESRRSAHQLRARVDGVVVGFRTVQKDDPTLDVRHVEGKTPIRVVVDPLAELEPDAKVVLTARDQPTWVIVGENSKDENLDRLLGLGVKVVRVPSGDGLHRVDLARAWSQLRQQGLQRLMVEGGGALTAQLFDAGLVDQVVGYLAPKIVGGLGAPSPVAGAGVDNVADARDLVEFYWQASGDDLAFGGFVASE